MVTVPSFFGGNTGLSYEELQRRRAFAEDLMKRGFSGQPRTAVEGINAGANKILGALFMKKIGAQEDAEREKAASVFRDLIAGGGSSYGGSAYGSAPMPPIDPNAPQSIGNSAMDALGKPHNAPPGLDAFNASLAKTESGGNYGVVNSEGYGGKYQFGQDRLDDFNRANGTNLTVAELVKPGNEALQEQVQAWHVADIDSRLGGYYGKAVNGQVMTPDAVRAMAHLGGIGGAKKFLETGGAYNPADSNGTTLAAYAGIHGGIDPRMLEAMANPYLNEGQRSALGMLLQQSREERARANQPVNLDTFAGPDGTVYSFNPQTGERKPLTGGKQPDAGGGVPASFQAMDMQAQAAGLVPGTPEYQNFMLNGGGSGTPAAFQALDLQAQAAGFMPGTPEYKKFMATRGAGLIAAAKAEGADSAALESLSSKMDGLETVVAKLGELADKATYTKAGQAYDYLRAQSGAEPREAAVARAEYIAMVDNQILPLLRDTFGSQFTAKEGETLRATLGDPDKTPAEKKAVLRSFIDQKKRDVEALQKRTGASESGDDLTPEERSYLGLP